MAFTPTEQALFDHARATLPRFLFQSATAPQDILGAYVKIFDAARAQVAEWLAQAFLTSATGTWLDQHARDRGTARQDGETDAALASRLRSHEDAVTAPALLARVNTLLATAALGTGAMVELRRDKAFAGRAFLSRGYRAGATAPRPQRFIVILPYGTPAGVKNSVTEYLRASKGAGYSYSVEVRANP